MCLIANVLFPLLFAAFQETAEAPSRIEAIRHVNPSNFLLLSGFLFLIGVAGVLTRRNIIIIMMSVELILNAANLNFIAFARYWELQGGADAVNGQLLTIFVIVVTAAEAAIGLALVIAYYRNQHTIAVDEINLLKW